MRISDWSSDVCSSDLCDGNSPCPLTVSFGKGMSGTFMFQSAPGDSGELISDDPNLVALIARGERPVLKVPAGFAEVGEVVLTDENLQEKDKAGDRKSTRLNSSH